ncbi:MAG: HAD-IC family P-type ATPase [Idiomarina sp.]|nr:HAD-IC family P-type ATPase [Idiomarina sp.]
MRSNSFHDREGEAIGAALETDLTHGLTQAQVHARLSEYGENKLPERRPEPTWQRLFRQFHNLLIYVLLVAASLAGILQEFIDMGVILAVVVVNVIIGFVQEGRAEKALRAIQGLLSSQATVVRDRRRQRINSTHLVPGDLVILEAGDRVPADLRLIKVRNLALQESALTGESMPVEKQTGSLAADTPLAARSNLAFSGTLVTQGQGIGIAYGTAESTELGRINQMLTQVSELTTPLLQQMARFARILTFIILSLATLVFVLGWWRGYELMYLFMAVVSLVVAAIPEGLPTILTVALAIGVIRMAKRRAIIRRLPAVETLGAVSVICSDKTGTLTRNEMTVTTIATPSGESTVTGVGYAPSGTISESPEQDQETLTWLFRTAALCNDASLTKKGEHWQVDGDPMEGALLSVAMKAKTQLEALSASWPRVDVIPFDSRYKFMATLHQTPAGNWVALIKGAPEAVLGLCDDSSDWSTRIASIAERGERVLGFGYAEFSERPNQLQTEHLRGKSTFLGLMGFIDPPREEAKEAIRACKSAGVRVVMITGDHQITAQAIGRDLGLTTEHGVLTGSELDQLDDTELDLRLERVSIFARTTPEQKLRLVTLLQAKGAVVAMTGDGVNDAPALKRADIGIAMGLKGTDAARESSEMVLTDDNFATIVNAVREGRTVYDNLKKAIAFLLPVNGGESLAIILALLLALTLPILPLQILWVNMVSSIALALALAFEVAEKDVMNRPPRTPREPLLSGFLLWRVILVSILFTIGIFGVFEWALAQGADDAYARTMAVNTLVAMEVWYLFSVRYLRRGSFFKEGLKGNGPVLLAVSLVFLLQLAFTYAPPLQQLFSTASLSLAHGFICVSIGVGVFVILEVEKALFGRLRTRPQSPG